jgi:hypothetical protein
MGPSSFDCVYNFSQASLQHKYTSCRHYRGPVYLKGTHQAENTFSILTGKETRRCGSWGLGNNDEINLVLAAFKPVLRVCCAWLPSNSDCPGR